ncbi:AAA family ATPase [Sphingomonas sp. DG1-23]|uniref:AAA family ATPase n=1 Tax=Sphingomonas sp. DG1-23 TaxID=3068316 RepID=UPI00273E7D66|nr:AAA family ATPase [Sphingomonas sp. DG1-23]MDP5277959.1 AAA family ATPase [Sphingomonas sp. DG1-23]
MNDETPRRYRGSLLERAAEQYGYLRPATPAVPIVVPEEEPLTLTELAPELPPVEAVPAIEVAPVAEAAPVVEIAATQPANSAPRTRRRQAQIDRIALREGGMLVPGDRVTALAEEFRMVKRQLLLTARAVSAKDGAKAADHARMILVCSAHPDEGKTFCAINLALSMAAEKDMEILLVDADFAKPDVLGRLGLAEGPGLLDALAGAVDDVEDCIIDTDVPQLSVLPAGTRTNGDTELLASDRARAILDGLAKANPRRIVIFDSPPALAASPASVLAMHAGQAMLVVRADRTSESDLREAVNVLDGCEQIQLLLNSVSFQPGGRRFGNYYGEAGE